MLESPTLICDANGDKKYLISLPELQLDYEIIKVHVLF